MPKTNKKTTTKKKAINKKNTTKSSAKKTSKKTNTNNKSSEMKQTQNAEEIRNKMQTWNKKLFRLAIVIAIIAGLAFLVRNVMFVAMVNGQPISRFQIINKLEEAQGATVLNNLIDETLIKQAIKKENVTISNEEVETAIKEIEDNLISQGQDFEQLLELQGMTREDLAEQVEMQKAIEQIIAKDIEVSEEEITQFLEENADFLPEDQTEEELQTLAEEQLSQQKLSEAYNNWITELKAEGSIKYFREY